MAAVDLESPSDGYRWRPERARAEEYVADFEMIAQRALGRPEWRGRLKLFRIYFLRKVEYQRAITLCGVAPGTFDYWVAEVKKTCGREFSRTGLFPPKDYFGKREKSSPESVANPSDRVSKRHRARRRSRSQRPASPELYTGDSQRSAGNAFVAAGPKETADTYS